MKVCALAGGVGGAKLASGLEAAMEPGTLSGDLSVVVNTADDFELWGLHISPDLDTVMYTLAGVANPGTGWGIRDETFEALGMVSAYGEDAWFRLGDRDLATHVLRTARLRAGESLTRVTRDLSAALGVKSRVLPMSDERVATYVQTPSGEVEFQEYFVRRGQRDEVLGVEFRGVEDSRPTGEVVSALRGADAIVFCPSNPLVSIGPLLAVPGMREEIEASQAPKVALSPIVGGRALKGPADRMLASTGRDSSATGVAKMYAGMIDGLVIDRADEGESDDIRSLGMEVLATDAVMRDEPDRERLAREVLDFVKDFAKGPGRGG